MRPRTATANGLPECVGIVFLLVFGAVCRFVGPRYVVGSGAAVARLQRLPEAIIGLTIVTAGVGPPVLLTTVVALASGMTSAVARQMISTNVPNIVFVLGLAALERPIGVPPPIAQADAYVLMAASGLVVAMMLPGWRITRLQGAIRLVSELPLRWFPCLASGIGEYVSLLPEGQ